VSDISALPNGSGFLLACVVAIMGMAGPSDPAVAESSPALQKPGFWSGRILTHTSRSPADVRVARRSDQIAAAVKFVLLQDFAPAELERRTAAPDAAEYISRVLQDAVIARLGAIPSSSEPLATTETNAGPISRAAVGADIVIDVRESESSLLERVFGAPEYYLFQFHTRVLVYDVHERTRIADQSCLETDRAAVSRDVLFAGDGAVLRQRLRKLWDQCVASIESTMFGLRPDVPAGAVR
jgi:hypothetical protein